MSLLTLSILNTWWRARALMGLVLVLTRDDPISEWLEKKHKGECKARPTLGIAEITALTGCWIQVCDSSKDDMDNWFSCSNMFKQESLIAINWWEIIFGWMNGEQERKISLTLKKISQKKTEFSAETEKLFAEGEHLFSRTAADLLKQLREVIQGGISSTSALLSVQNRAIKWSHTKKGSEEAKRGSSLRCLGKYRLFKICIGVRENWAS